MKKLIFVALLPLSILSLAQDNWDRKFEQLGTTLPSPNSYRLASGAPGPEYWQQKADYEMSIKLDDENQSIYGYETITYYNQSPNPLEYLWMQLDQNMRRADSETYSSRAMNMEDTLDALTLQYFTDMEPRGFNIEEVTDADGSKLSYLINKTMMRINLPETLAPGEKIVFNVKWNYNINARMNEGGRSGYEYFPGEDNYAYTIAQFFPRMAVYDDKEGWQNKQFLGRGEFALAFGDYEVSIDVPADFIVASTGELQNPGDVLTAEQRKRLDKARTSFDEPVLIVTEKEAIENEKTKSTDRATWTFKAEFVRDFAFAASRKYIWDAMAVDFGDKKPLAMSFYPKEGNPLWGEYSTRVVAHTLKSYSKYTFDYPYPVAISVHDARNGMEYPMICFNYGRPEDDGTYTDRVKWGMIGVIIHEVGHNYFPMIVNSDERQWTWMDEGLDSFVEIQAKREWDPNFPMRRDENYIAQYMSGEFGELRPIMTNSEQIPQFGNNAYGKPAIALSVLRNVVMGPELFDYAFKKYSQRWMFKHPSPADFFRTMEDASAVDLDWFWNGWFYTTDHVDISVKNVNWYQMATEDDDLETRDVKVSSGNMDSDIGSLGGEPKKFTFDESVKSSSSEFRNTLNTDQIKLALEGENFYEITFTNEGGLVMPIIIEWTYADGTKEVEKLPAEIWRMNESEVTKVFAKSKQVVNVQIDPEGLTADANDDNNVYPRQESQSRFDKFSEGQ